MPFSPETKKEVWLALRADGELGSGLPGNPYDASSATLFDDRMNSFQVNTTIHLGAGVFQTRGDSAWNPKSGWRIIGAGIYATILKLVLKPDASVPNTYWAIGTGGYLNGFEASEFTVDCNLDGQMIGNSTFPLITCGAISLKGRNTRLRRIRAINFGTMHKDYESFPFVPTFALPGQAEAANGVIESCIMEKPGLKNAGTITCINIGSIEDPLTGAKAFHRACVLRNCVLNCEFVDNPVAISSIGVAGTTATATTKFPHYRSPGQWVVVTGALLNGSLANNYNGSYQITSVGPDPKVFTYTLVDYSGTGIPTVSPTGDMYIGKYPSQTIPIQSIALDPSTLIATLTTTIPHNRVLGNNVYVFNVLTGTFPNETIYNAYNDAFQIVSIASPTQLTYQMASNPGNKNVDSAFIGAIFQALSADGGTGTIVAGNRVYNARIGGPYHDTYATKDIIILKNYYSSVVTGPYSNMGDVSTNAAGLLRSSTTPMTRSGTDNQTATFTTPLPHGFSVGEPVQITGANQPPYNGTFPVTSIPSPTQSTYHMDSDPLSNASGVLFTYAALWQTGRWVVENNIIDLVVSNSGYGYPIAVDLFDHSGEGFHGSQYLFPQVIIRGNFIRHVDSASDPTQFPLGIDLDSCQNAIVEDNIINLDTANPVRHNTVLSVQYLNNQASSGRLIQGYSYNVAHYVNEVTTDADLAACLST